MLNKFKLKHAIGGLIALAVVISAFLVHALAGLNSKAIKFAEPPSFVALYGAELSNGEVAQHSSTKKITADFEREQALVMRVMFEGESPDTIFKLFAHPDREQRVKIASAFSAVNIEFTHNEESGYPAKREIFWKAAQNHLGNIQNALYEALITSAIEGTQNHIPYTLAWMPGQGDETVEVLAWSAQHHPDWWVRRFSVFFVAEFGGNDQLAYAVLNNQTHDPDYRVRREVLDQRVQRLLGS